MKYTIIIGSLALLATLVMAGEHEVKAVHRSNGVNYKDRALAFCIADAYKGSQAGEDAHLTASIYLDLTYYDHDADHELIGLINDYLRRDYGHPLEGYKDAKFNLLKCIDLYHSKELDLLVKKHVYRPNAVGHKGVPR